MTKTWKALIVEERCAFLVCCHSNMLMRLYQFSADESPGFRLCLLSAEGWTCWGWGLLILELAQLTTMPLVLSISGAPLEEQP